MSGNSASSNTQVIGQSVLRPDAVGKVTGQTAYPGDIDMDGQLWMKVRFSDRVHARVLSVDTSRADSYPGVVAIFTARAIPRNEYGLIKRDQPVLCGQASDKAATDIMRCLAAHITTVVAENE